MDRDVIALKVVRGALEDTAMLLCDYFFLTRTTAYVFSGIYVNIVYFFKLLGSPRSLQWLNSLNLMH